MGFENGLVAKINLQSGIVRNYCLETDFHDGPITGIKTDPLNKIVITTGMDGTVKIWDFYRLKLMHTITMEDSVALANLTVSNANLFCFTTSDLSLFVYDFQTMKCIRRFDNIASNAITSVCFSHDSKWVITASMDKSLKVWDLLTATLVDWIVFCDTPLAIAFSPTGEYLTTTHVNKKGK